jgi:hypothetical protein
LKFFPLLLLLLSLRYEFKTMLLSAPPKANQFAQDGCPSGAARAKPEPDALVAGRLRDLARNFVAPSFSISAGVGVVADAAEGWSVASGEGGAVVAAVQG